MRRVVNIGINDTNFKITKNGKKLKSYEVWQCMLLRCYSRSKFTVAYESCSVCTEWLYFSNFKKWFDKNYIEGYHLDKDLLIKGNKIYSPETCCFIPQEINKLFTRRTRMRGDLPIGVSLERKTKGFVSSMTHNGESKYLGFYKTKEDAFLAYKREKERLIKELAEEYYNKGMISETVRNAMFKYNVEITD